MREIVFRAKRKDNGEWVYGSLLIQAGERINKDELTPAEYRILGCRGENHLVDPKTVGEYTGLTGGKGTKIFEGDIVKGTSEYFGNSLLNQKAVVLYDRGQFLLAFGETLTECKQLNDFEVVGVWNADVEVIGNVHDNLD